MNSATTKLLAISITTSMMAAAITITAFLSSTISIQKATAQMTAQPPVGRMGLGMMMAAPNVTGSSNIF